MKTTKRNIKFAYLYRDASNYKQHGNVVFTIPQRFNTDNLDHRLRQAMMVDSTFIADQVRVPNLFLFDTMPMNEDDHCLHEFESLEIVNERPNDPHERSIVEFVREVERAALQGWEGFVPSPTAITPSERFRFLV